MRALSIWQPMAWTISRGIKPVENRTWPLPAFMLQQKIAIHASKTYSKEWATTVRSLLGIETPERDRLALGAVVAVTTLVACIREHQLRTLSIQELERWGLADKRLSITDFFSGPYGFLLGHTQALEEPVFCRGAQGFWKLDAETEEKVWAQIVSTSP